VNTWTKHAVGTAGRIVALAAVLVGQNVGGQNVGDESGLDPQPPASDGGQRIEGELPIELAGQLVQGTTVPTVGQLAAAVETGKPQAVAVIKLFGDRNNHYAPVWSSTGRTVAYLRSDLARGTRKVITHRLGRQPTVLYADRTSFEDSAAWSSGAGNALVFSSTNEASGNQNIHVWTGAAPPRRLTSGSGVIAFPAMHGQGTHRTMLYRRGRELFAHRQDAGRRGDDADQTRSLGEGEEAVMSPDGRLLAVVRRNEAGQRYRLMLREMNGQRQKTLHETGGAIIRNPRFSPDGRWIAFHGRPIQQTRWELWVVSLSNSGSARRLATDVRVQEDFRHVGPAWNVHSNGLWYFADTNDQAHYPLFFADLTEDAAVEVAYPSQITSASEPACSPVADLPILLFAGHTRKPRDIFAIILSEMP